MTHHTFPLDVKRREETLSLITKIRPSVVIDTAALHEVDYCEEHKEECRAINVTGTENVAKACKAAGSKLVFISTDYIFDGKKKEYGEADKPNPLSHYGRCKLEAEELIKSIGLDYAIARTAVLYGWNPTKLNFVTWVIRELKAGKEIRVVDDQYSNPTLADDLAGMLLKIIEKSETGVFHTTGSECISRFEFAKKVAEAFSLDVGLVKPVKTKDLKQKAVRPKRCGMNTGKITGILGRKPLTASEGLEKMRTDTND
jgi:dTDP-4-dehydrorhamnose reductase